jgi:hypothetical protein
VLGWTQLGHWFAGAEPTVDQTLAHALWKEAHRERSVCVGGWGGTEAQHPTLGLGYTQT